MSPENTSDHNYRLGYAVCAIFLIAFILMTWAVVSDMLHRGELEQVVAQSIATPAATPSNQ
jgi:hypothetical protein